MTKLVKSVTPVEVTDPHTGETMMCCSRPIIDGPCLWLIFTEHYHGHMDLYQALTSVDGRRFDRRTVLSRADMNRARNAFRAIEKYGRENGKPCIPINGRQAAIDRQIEFLNKDRDAEGGNGRWAKKANAAAREAQKLPRGKTAIRLADTTQSLDIAILKDAAMLSDQISDTYGERSSQLAEPIGMLRHQVKLARHRQADNENAQNAHADRMDAA
jgi:hypothetical protein